MESPTVTAIAEDAPVLDLKWSQIDWESNTIRIAIGTTKSKRDRTPILTKTGTLWAH